MISNIAAHGQKLVEFWTQVSAHKTGKCFVWAENYEKLDTKFLPLDNKNLSMGRKK